MADSGTVYSRATIEQLVDDATVCHWLATTAAWYPDHPAYSWLAEGEWRSLTWSELRRQVLEVAAGLVAVGLAPGESVAIMAGNRIEHVVADLATVHAGGVPVSVRPGLSAEQIGHIAGDCAVRVAIVEDADGLRQWEQAWPVLPTLTEIVVLDAGHLRDYVPWGMLFALGRDELAADPAGLARRWQAVRSEDPATIVYTSGTTGPPKGVVLTHRNVRYEAIATTCGAQLPVHPITVSYLPYALIVERVVGLYLPIYLAAHVHLCADSTQLPSMLREVRPTVFFGVPRAWARLRAGLAPMLAAGPEDRRRRVAAAMDIGLAYVRARQYGSTPPPELLDRYHAVDRAVLAPLRATLGLSRAAWTANCAASLPEEDMTFFAGLGVRILDVYGLTETCGSVTTNTPTAFRLGTVGRAVPGIEVRLADDGEILVRGPVVTPGYHGCPEATSALIDEEGWVRTGDFGRVDGDGFLSVVGRK